MYDITIQYAAAQQHAPAASHLEQWAKAALSEQCDAAELTIRIVDVTEIKRQMFYPFHLMHQRVLQKQKRI